LALGAVLLVVITCGFVASKALAAEMQKTESADLELNRIHELYQQLLDTYTYIDTKNTLPLRVVDYASLRSDDRLDELSQLFEQYPKPRLQTREQKIAFYLNAYNVLAIQMVVDNWPLKRLRSLGSFVRPVWTHPAGKVCSEAMTLRKLEHKILRQLGDARIHFALNCASVSCPDLRGEPYVAERLDEQLTEQTRLFLSQTGKGMAVTNNGLLLSPIFDWFEEDFEVHGGVLVFLKRYLPNTLSADNNWEIAGYFRYDWDVNAHLTGGELSRIRRGSVTWFD